MSERRKILMLMTQLGYGGAETSFIRLANYLAQSMDVTVALFTSDYGMEVYAEGHEPLNAQIVLIDNKLPEPQLFRWVRRILTVRKLKKTHDVTISFLSGPNLVNALAGTPSRTVVSLRGSRKYDPVATTGQRLLFQLFLDPLTFLKAGYIVPVSRGIQYEMGPRFAPKIHPIPPFVETAMLQQRLADPLPEPYRKLKGEPVMIAVGRLSVEKGFQHLIRVFAILAQQQIGAKLVLVGDGPMMEALRVQCTEAGLRVDDFTPGIVSVIFAGYQKNVLPFMSLARVYALTSSTEGFPSVLLEAMAAGVPVMAADTPWGARAIIGEYDVVAPEPYPTRKPVKTAYGTLMPRIDHPTNAQIWVTALKEHLNRAGSVNEAAHAHVATFDIAKVGAQWRELIERVVAT